jgi:deazaflavin-dependent oxidoreductase (nitroreductase family)
VAFPNIQPLIRAIAFTHRLVYRASGGRLGATLGGKPMLLLSTKGRRSGRERTTPLLYHQDGENFVVVGSNGGDPRHPAWFLNLMADPAVRVQAGRRKLACQARVAGPEERTRLWPKLCAEYAGYADYETRSEREIPVVILAPRPE